ncbi:MAG: Flp pilus assembly protein CpaB [Candidatus Solibacter usitatus]|nr:Flp pilus assembly protein CpaB [Candidatus Solibacter usitatus]
MDRQRTLIIFGAAWLSAALLTWFLWAKTKAPQVEKTTSVAAAIKDMAAGTRLRAADLKLVKMPTADLPKSALLDAKLAEGRALLYPVMANEPLTTNKLSSTGGAEGLPATIDPGMRAVSIPISDVSGVAGLIQPRSRVDVLFTRPGSMAEAMTTVVLEDVAVMSINRNTEITPSAPAPGASGASAPAQTNLSVTQTRAVTLLVTPEDARKLELAKNQGRLSLALRNPLDRSRMTNREAVTAEVLDPQLFTRVRRPQMVGGGPGAIRDAKAWAALTGEEPKKEEKKKEPPKPRLVVDVFRGDKHLQESFQ